MKPTRVSALLAVAIVVGVAVWLALHFAYGALPPLPWTAVPTLGLLALAELSSAFNIRARIRRKRGTRPVEPLVVARFAALGKASAYTAALVAGGFCGMLVYVLSDLDKRVPRHDAAVSGGTFAMAVAFAVVALFLEHSCRVPKPPDEREREYRRHR